MLISQITYIPNSNFEQALIDLGIDSDGTIDGQVLTSDIDTVTVLNVRYKQSYDLTGTEAFTALEDLNIELNHMQPLDLSVNSELKTRNCISHPCNSLNILQNQQLESLD